VLLVIRSGDRLEEDSAPGPTSPSVREGRVRFTAREVVEEAGPETALTCDAGVLHIVEALDDAVCLLTIGARAAEGASEYYGNIILRSSASEFPRRPLADHSRIGTKIRVGVPIWSFAG
jgi:hypothetical protein